MGNHKAKHLQKRVVPDRIRKELDKKNIVIVTGFQGLNRYDDMTTLGRNGTKDISFTVGQDNLKAAIEMLNPYAEALGASSVVYDENVAKVSIVGAGMESHPGVAAEMFEANINIQMISTSEIKISLLIAAEDADKAVTAVHNKFFAEAMKA